MPETALDVSHTLPCLFPKITLRDEKRGSNNSAELPKDTFCSRNYGLKNSSNSYSETWALSATPHQKEEKTPKLFITGQVNVAQFDYSVYLVTCDLKLISRRHQVG